MTTVVDTSALLALLYDEGRETDVSESLASEAAEGPLVINPVVYAELAADATFGDQEALDYFLDDLGITVETPGKEADFQAGTAFQEYLHRRGDALECPSCGAESIFECPDCGAHIGARQHIAADFLIGAHAEESGRLLTFDSDFYRGYFDIEVLHPGS